MGYDSTFDTTWRVMKRGTISLAASQYIFCLYLSLYLLIALLVRFLISTMLISCSE